MDTAAVWVAYGWIGWLLVVALQIAAWMFSGCVGVMLFRRLRRIYHLVVISYWLDRLEREGARTFQRPDAPTPNDPGTE